MAPKEIFSLLKDTFTEWGEDKASRLGAAVAYYTVFSLAPLLVVIIAVAGLVWGQKAVQGQLFGQIQGTVGPDSAQMIQTMVANASKPSSGIIATVIGLVTLLLGATGLFGELQDDLNTIWEVAPKPRGILETIKERALSFGMVLVIAFLLLVSLALSAGIAAAGQLIGNVLPVPEFVLHVVNFAISFAIITLLFALIYKVLPDAEIDWHDVWVGAAVTSLLFTIGKLVIGIYLGHSGTSSTYGAAGSLVVILLWVYYSAQILFFGAEFTQLYANRYGSHVKPAPDATAVADQLRTKDLRPDTEHVDKPSDKKLPSDSEKPAAARRASEGERRSNDRTNGRSDARAKSGSNGRSNDTDRRPAATTTGARGPASGRPKDGTRVYDPRGRRPPTNARQGGSRAAFGAAVVLGVALSAIKGFRSLGKNRGSGAGYA